MLEKSPLSAGKSKGDPALLAEAFPHSAKELTELGNPRKYVEFLVLAIASIALWWQPLVSTLRLALSSDAYTYILLIVPVSLGLIYVERTQVSSSSSSRRWSGSILLVGAILLRVIIWNYDHSSATGGLSLSIFALVVWWIGSVIVCFGVRTFRSQLFAECLLFLLVPLPDGVVNWIIEGLQNTSASASQALFRLAQVPVARQGVILSIPGLDIEVAHECSSIRSSTMLIVLTLLLAHLFLRSNWRKVLLVLAAIPLSILKNAVRIFTIAELATRVDPAYLDGNLHRHGGVVFLGFSVLLIVLLLWLLRKGELRMAT